jgi:hypothetical protein
VEKMDVRLVICDTFVPLDVVCEELSLSVDISRCDTVDTNATVPVDETKLVREVGEVVVAGTADDCATV